MASAVSLGQARFPDARPDPAPTGCLNHGTMTFDSADVASMVCQRHVSNRWSCTRWATCSASARCGDSFWPSRSGSNYIGANAVNAYRQLANNNALTSVPLEDHGADPAPPNVHWSEGGVQHGADDRLLRGRGRCHAAEHSDHRRPAGPGLSGELWRGPTPYSLLVAGSETAGAPVWSTPARPPTLQPSGGGGDDAWATTMDEGQFAVRRRHRPARLLGRCAAGPADPAIYWVPAARRLRRRLWCRRLSSSSTPDTPWGQRAAAASAQPCRCPDGKQGRIDRIARPLKARFFFAIDSCTLTIFLRIATLKLRAM